MGLFALGAGIFGVTALGMGIMAGIVAVGVAKGELDPSPQVSFLAMPKQHHPQGYVSISLAVHVFVGIEPWQPLSLWGGVLSTNDCFAHQSSVADARSAGASVYADV